MGTALLFICILSGLVTAAPTTQNRRGLERRDDGSNGLKPQVWVPILVVGLLVIIIASMTWSKRKFSVRWSSIGHAAAAGAGAIATPSGPIQTRELTADQLTGGNTSNNDSTSNNGNSNTTRPRRTRRPRRTPSQISTTSLPAYNKDPGEQEVVIFRGPADMEDVPMDSVTAAVEMPTVEEDGDSENSVRERYAPMPDSPHDMPLLQNEDEELGSRSFSALSLPTGNGQGRRSVETTNSNSADGSSLARVDTTLTTDDTPDPRGAAPAYFEVVDLNDLPTAARNDNVTTTTSTSHNTQTESSQTPATTRRSFRISNIFGRSGSHRASQSTSSATRPPVPPPPGIPVPTANPGHARTGSAGGFSLTSTVSRSTQGSPAARSRSRIGAYTYGHRPSHSNSSLLSLVNPLNRKKSTATLNSNDLTSPSMISLHSISSPLSHTLVKTEFTYPKSGPTPEQLKLISSRESFARFGMPYGADAVRWAKSRTELVDESVPPPEFEEIAGTSSGSSQGASGSGTSSNESGGSTSTSATSDVGGSSRNANVSPSSSNISPPEIVVDAASKPSSPRTPARSLSPSAPDPKVDVSTTETRPPAAPTSLPPSSSTSKPAPSPSVDPITIPIPESPPLSPTSTLKAKSLPSPSSPSPVPVPPVPSLKANTKSQAVPPSAFRAPVEDITNDPYARAESRASSFRSFATANESLNEFGERMNGAAIGTGAGSGNGTFNSMRSETPALSIAESRYYSDYDEDSEGDTYRFGVGDDSESGGETETEGDDHDERLNRRLTVRAAA
ncbi:hypothetical protein V5O48_007034 [Marasmius crinis-equi]|uniref:Uncharacterized protein n=1 Tax=Marasmius crinis-equi TaxID=585013 RepID=A0ABR3FHU1_9AGAR